MIEVSAKEARSKLSALLDRVALGEEIIVTRHGRKVAHLTPLSSENRLPILKDFRNSLQSAGSGLSGAVIADREEIRY